MPTVIFKDLSTVLRDPKIPNCYSSSFQHIVARICNSLEYPDVRNRQCEFDEILLTLSTGWIFVFCTPDLNIQS